jgi:adenylate kinase
MKNSNPLVIIIFGAPGAGKGSQAELLAEKFSLYYFETSKILEQNFKKAENLSENSPERFIETDGQKYDILNEKKIWKEGILCSPAFVAYLVQEKIKKLAEEGKNLVIAGSPRTVYEGERVIPLLKNLYSKENIKVILIDISPKESIFRNSHRLICELMRHPILYSKETKNLKNCPVDGSKLLKREGLDDPETIKVRLEEYKKRTLPLFELFEKEGIKIEKINGEQTVANVFGDIIKNLNL